MALCSCTSRAIHTSGLNKRAVLLKGAHLITRLYPKRLHFQGLRFLNFNKVKSAFVRREYKKSFGHGAPVRARWWPVAWALRRVLHDRIRMWRDRGALMWQEKLTSRTTQEKDREVSLQCKTLSPVDETLTDFSAHARGLLSSPLF